MYFFLTEMGGTPLPPLTDSPLPKSQRKKVNGRGNPPLPLTESFRDLGLILNPSLSEAAASDGYSRKTQKPNPATALYIWC